MKYLFIKFCFLFVFTSVSACGPCLNQNFSDASPQGDSGGLIQNDPCGETGAVPHAEIIQSSNYLNGQQMRDGANEPYQSFDIFIRSTVPIRWDLTRTQPGFYIPVVYVNDVRQGSLVHNGKALGLWLVENLQEATPLDPVICWNGVYSLTLGFGVPPQTVPFGTLLPNGSTVRFRVDVCENVLGGTCYRGTERSLQVIAR